MRLYTYHRSSASYRVRIALEWKGLAREDVHIDLGRDEQFAPEFLAENPNGRVPFLVDGDVRLGQALAILEYLEECHPEPPLLPRSSAARAHARELALLIVADTQPLQNTGPFSYLADPLGVTDPDRIRWYRHWVSRGLGVFERLLASSSETGRFCVGDEPSLADVCVVPQVVNWLRNSGGDLADWPTLSRVFDTCQALEAFQRAAPERQPDAPGS
ncbi:MAG: maleylacetoacetate isomerase [Deltaproteobacteria bacterium]|nr:maleylacetoacetate isomerase [Deltaproteobacteria bacterium]